MTTHNHSFTAMASEAIAKYSSVILTFEFDSTDGIPLVSYMTNAEEEAVIGTAMQDVAAGELLTVAMAYSGIIPALCIGVGQALQPGDRVTALDTGNPGVMTNSVATEYDAPHAYVLATDTAGLTGSVVRCDVVFVRSCREQEI